MRVAGFPPVRRRARFLVVLALAAVGCVREDLVPYAYEVPIAGNTHGANAAYTCVAACRSAYGNESAGFFGCLGTCPDVRIVEGAECDANAPPTSVCFTELVPKMVPDEETTAAVFLDALGAILDAATSPHGGHGSSHGSEHHHARK
jgi:hypothetical protein